MPMSILRMLDPDPPGRLPLRLYDTEAQAEDAVRRLNRTASGDARRSLVVLVDGPDDDFAVMDLREAIEAGITYRWAR